MNTATMPDLGLPLEVEPHIKAVQPARRHRGRVVNWTRHA